MPQVISCAWIVRLPSLYQLYWPDCLQRQTCDFHYADLLLYAPILVFHLPAVAYPFFLALVCRLLISVSLAVGGLAQC